MCALATILSPASPAAPMPIPQTRGYFFSLTRSLSERSLELELDRVAGAGFNLLVFPVLNNGWTLWPSEAMRGAKLAAINPLFKRWNPVGRALELAKAGTLDVWGFARPFNFHPRYAVSESRILRQHPDWRMRVSPLYSELGGRNRESWLPCTNNPDYRRHIADVLGELIAGYPVVGLVLDMTLIGFQAGSLAEWPYCFCAQCRRLFAEEEDDDLGEVAAAASHDPAQLERLRLWQMDRLQNTLEYLRNRLLRNRRTVRLLALASPHWRERAGFDPLKQQRAALARFPRLLASGQIEEMLVDHEGLPIEENVGDWLAADYAYLGDRVLTLPMFSVGSAEELRLPLRKVEQYAVPGFIADFQEPLSQDDVQLLRSEFFTQDVPLPESDPIRTAIYLLERVRQAHRSLPRVHDLLADIIRLLARQRPVPTDFNMLQVIEQNISGFEQFVRRGRLGGQALPESSLRDLGLARRFVRLACLDVRT